MSKRRCMKCDEIKEINSFIENKQICSTCIKTPKKTRTIGKIGKIGKIDKIDKKAFALIDQIVAIIDLIDNDMIIKLNLFDFNRYSRDELVEFYSISSLRKILRELNETNHGLAELKDIDLLESLQNTNLQVKKSKKVLGKEQSIKSERQLIKEILKGISEMTKEDIEDLGLVDFKILSIRELEGIYAYNTLIGILKEVKGYKATEHINEEAELIKEIIEQMDKMAKKDIEKLGLLDFEIMSSKELENIYAYDSLLEILKEIKHHNAIENKRYKHVLIKEIVEQIEDMKEKDIEDLGLLDFQTLSIQKLKESYTCDVLVEILDDIKYYKASKDKDKIEMINKIIHLIEGLDTEFLLDSDYLKFQEYTVGALAASHTKEELTDIIDELEDPTFLEDYGQELIDPLEIIKKYEHGSYKDDNKEDAEIEKEVWRRFVPSSLKKKMPHWQTASINEVYRLCRELLSEMKGSGKDEILSFSCELSEIIFANEEQENDDEMEIPQDEMADTVMSLVEMIILPHQEVLDRINEKNGNIIFKNVWSEPFSEELKKEVKDRDGWKCVICDDDTNLHVHHKIPRKLGGVNHKNNLVTLCGSCHGVIETADVQKAFQKCFANYKKNRNKKMRTFDHIKKDKSLLKEEVEHELDKLLLALSNKDEAELVKSLTETMNKLEIIFYD